MRKGQDPKDSTRSERAAQSSVIFFANNMKNMAELFARPTSKRSECRGQAPHKRSPVWVNHVVSCTRRRLPLHPRYRTFFGVAANGRNGPTADSATHGPKARSGSNNPAPPCRGQTRRPDAEPTGCQWCWDIQRARGATAAWARRHLLAAVKALCRTR
jgi:hypothetical protein